MCSLESKIKYSAGSQQQRNKPSLRTILIQHGQRQLKAAFPWNTCVQPPKQQSSVCLRAANPLLALMDRPGSVRDFVIDGMLTEPLNTVRLSWGRRFWNAHTHARHVHLSTAGLTLQFCVVRPQNMLNPRPYQGWVSGQQVSKNCKIIFCSLVQRLAAHATRQSSAELHGHMQATERIHGIIPGFPWKDGLQA